MLYSNDTQLYGRQPERFLHGYYDSYCYLPLYIFADDQLLCARPRRFAALNKIVYHGWAVIELDRVPDKTTTPKEAATISKEYLAKTFGFKV